MTDLSQYRVGPTKIRNGDDLGCGDYRDGAGNVIKVEKIK